MLSIACVLRATATATALLLLVLLFYALVSRFAENLNRNAIVSHFSISKREAAHSDISRCSYSL